jgi:hypothetical protein
MENSETELELDSHLLSLIMMVLLHSIFSISTFIFIIVFAMGKNYPILNTIVAVTVISFLFFNRCIAIDAYEYLRKDRENIPEIARDDLARNILKTITRKTKKPKDEKHTSLRLDIIKNIKPIVDCNDHDVVMKFISRKMHYIVINIIITVIFLIQIKKPQYIPLLVLWLSYHFNP